jgi:hypothetical protein
MGTLNAFYVRASDPSKSATLRAQYPSAFTEAGTTFYAVELPNDCFKCPDAELQSLSAQLGTDVVWVSFQSAVDAFQYHHWRNGNHLRSLVYGCFENEREWEQVEGQPQEWEAAVIFGNLGDALRFRTDEEERRSITRIYASRLIEVGADEPSLDGRETARGVAEFFGFPGWSLGESDANDE